MDRTEIPLIHEIPAAGRRGVLPPSAPPEDRNTAVEALPDHLRRETPPPLPEVSELEAVRHFTRLSQRNYCIDGQFYPLGSCTMKYNPRLNEKIAAMPAFTQLHPRQEEADVQGVLRVCHDMQEVLKPLLGLDEATVAPAAGAQGEFVGMSIIKAWHEDHGTGRDEVLVPDAAHGTNPASAVLAGFKVREVKSGPDGRMDLESLRANLGGKTAGIMLTNPNTCGLFEKDIVEVARLVHEAGGLLYYDGANLNAIAGRARPGDMGFDVVHVNLHKTFSTPHGGGGPGSGPVAVSARLAPYLPTPHVVRGSDDSYRLSTPEKSIGRMLAFHGNTGVVLRAMAYALSQGGEGLRAVADHSALNANYILARLPEVFERPFGSRCMHEAVVTVRGARKEKDIRAFDVAKRLLDLGFHSPTVYFPLLVPECFLIEPTETESKDTLDRFIAAMEQIAREIESQPEVLTSAPNELPTGRLDEAAAAKELNVCCRF